MALLTGRPSNRLLVTCSLPYSTSTNTNPLKAKASSAEGRCFPTVAGCLCPVRPQSKTTARSRKASNPHRPSGKGLTPALASLRRHQPTIGGTHEPQSLFIFIVFPRPKSRNLAKKKRPPGSGYRRPLRRIKDLSLQGYLAPKRACWL